MFGEHALDALPASPACIHPLNRGGKSYTYTRGAPSRCAPVNAVNAVNVVNAMAHAMGTRLARDGHAMVMCMSTGVRFFVATHVFIFSFCKDHFMPLSAQSSFFV